METGLCVGPSEPVSDLIDKPGRWRYDHALLAERVEYGVAGLTPDRIVYRIYRRTRGGRQAVGWAITYGVGILLLARFRYGAAAWEWAREAGHDAYGEAMRIVADRPPLEKLSGYAAAASKNYWPAQAQEVQS